jgi:N-acetylglutamate synthase-like GNAT family acetyltransferase
MPATIGLHARGLRLSDAATREDIQYIEDRIDEFNITHTGITDARLMTIVLRDDDGRIIAGLHGWTWGRSCEIRTLWVHERLRGFGVGTRLMLSAEAEAQRRGATQILLSTHSFQAPAFYRRLGFEIVGEVADHPRGHRSLYLRKGLDDPAIISR